MRKKWVIILILLLVAGGGAFYVWKKPGRHRRGEGTVERVEAKLGSIQDSVEATGEVLPLNRVAINAPVAGRIDQLLVAEGALACRAGQILALDEFHRPRRHPLDAARAQGPDAFKKWNDAYKPTAIVGRRSMEPIPFFVGMWSSDKPSTPRSPFTPCPTG